MSRHRDVRSMNYSDEYDGYDDVYGHSVEDDYCISPSAEQFLFDRSKQQNIASFITEPDIVEDNEEVDESIVSFKKESDLTDLETAKLMSCMESVRNVIGDSVPENKLKDKIIKSNFDVNTVLDAILQESSHKETPIINKESFESCPGASIDKINTLTFTVPKLSFKQSPKLPADLTMSLTNNIKSLKNSTSNNIPMTFSSLTGISKNHSKPIALNSIETSFQCNTDTRSFHSLADLTAHHLQKSNNVINDRNSFGKPSFVIPKLATKTDKDNIPINTHSSNMSNTHTNIIKQSTTYALKKDESLDTLRKSLSNTHLDLENSSRLDMTNVQMVQKDTLNTTDSIHQRTPSPDNWMIDLSTALKEVEFLHLNNLKAVASYTNVYPDISLLNIYGDNNTITSSSSMTNIECTLDLSGLKDDKLPYTKENVSLFGKTLCRKWKSRRPIIKCHMQKYKTIKPFDFSTPYSRA